MVVNEATEEFRQTIRSLLHERFRNEFEFGPIVVMPRSMTMARSIYTRISSSRETRRI